MAKIKIVAVCVVEGEPLDIMEHYHDAVESLENGGGMYGEVRVRVVSVEGMDFEELKDNNLDLLGGDGEN